MADGRQGAGTAAANSSSSRRTEHQVDAASGEHAGALVHADVERQLAPRGHGRSVATSKRSRPLAHVRSLFPSARPELVPGGTGDVLDVHAARARCLRCAPSRFPSGRRSTCNYSAADASGAGSDHASLPARRTAASSILWHGTAGTGQDVCAASARVGVARLVPAPLRRRPRHVLRRSTPTT